MAVVADTAAAVANTARSFITVVRNADMCPPKTRAGGLPCLVSRACCRVALIPPSAADTVRQIKQVVSMSPGALQDACLGIGDDLAGAHRLAGDVQSREVAPAWSRPPQTRGSRSARRSRWSW